MELPIQCNFLSHFMVDILEVILCSSQYSVTFITLHGRHIGSVSMELPIQCNFLSHFMVDILEVFLWSSQYSVTFYHISW